MESPKSPHWMCWLCPTSLQMPIKCAPRPIGLVPSTLNATRHLFRFYSLWYNCGTASLPWLVCVCVHAKWVKTCGLVESGCQTNVQIYIYNVYCSTSFESGCVFRVIAVCQPSCGLSGCAAPKKIQIAFRPISHSRRISHVQHTYVCDMVAYYKSSTCAIIAIKTCAILTGPKATKMTVPMYTTRTHTHPIHSTYTYDYYIYYIGHIVCWVCVCVT